MIAKIRASIILSVTMMGCEVPDKAAVIAPEKPYELQHDKKGYILNFSHHQSKLSAEEQARLISELKPFGPGKASVHITLPSQGSKFGKQRLKNIIRVALQAGVKPKQIHHSETLLPATGDTIQINLDTYRAIPPTCPNWSSTFGSGYERRKSGNFGCATASNFLLLIDDPIVLFKAEPTLSRDSARDSLAIADHRAGKDKGKWLKVEKSDTGPSGSSGSGSS